MAIIITEDFMFGSHFNYCFIFALVREGLVRHYNYTQMSFVFLFKQTLVVFVVNTTDKTNISKET